MIIRSGMIDIVEIIAIVESDDYGPAAIVDPEHITIFLFEDFYLAATRCMYTDRPITCEISEKTARSLMIKGVRCLDAYASDQSY